MNDVDARLLAVREEIMSATFAGCDGLKEGLDEGWGRCAFQAADGGTLEILSDWKKVSVRKDSELVAAYSWKSDFTQDATLPSPEGDPASPAATFAALFERKVVEPETRQAVKDIIKATADLIGANTYSRMRHGSLGARTWFRIFGRSYTVLEELDGILPPVADASIAKKGFVIVNPAQFNAAPTKDIREKLTGHEELSIRAAFEEALAAFLDEATVIGIADSLVATRRRHLSWM